MPTRFFALGACCFAGFVIHYFVPFQWKKTTFIMISLLGAVIVLLPENPEANTEVLRQNAVAQADEVSSMAGDTVLNVLLSMGFVLGVGLAFYLCLRLPVSYWIRLALVIAIAAALVYGRMGNRWLPDSGLYWPLVGAIFMFRMIIYCYDLKSAKAPERLDDFLCYFFMLPNFYFLLFPVIDYTTFKRCHFAADIHQTAQRGIHWIARGVLQLSLYRITYHWLIIGPDEVHSFLDLLRYIVPMYWLYLLVSGSFHIITGMLHLYGYRLPETNNSYFLACGFTDLWRRINIYWKDFMVKVFYYPVYFRLRKKGENLGLIVGTICVFTATIVLHGYQYFWLRNEFRVSGVDLIFWILMGSMVLLTVLWEVRAKRPRPAAARGFQPGRIVKIVATYLTFTLLWSIWYGNSWSDWINTVTYWR